MLRIGLARRDITPGEPLYLLGYGDRDHRYEGIHDPLEATALAFCSGDNPPVIILSVDLCLFSRASAEAIKAEIVQRTGIAGEHLYIHASHTHSAPDVFAIHEAGGGAERAYYELLLERFSDAVSGALYDARPGYVEFRQGTCTVGVNRRGLGKPLDSRLFLLSMRDASHALLGMAFYYSCHPTTLGVENYQVSSDWVGPARAALREEYGVPVLFLQGAEGNVDPRSRGVLNLADPRQAYGCGFDVVEELGREVADAVGAAVLEVPFYRSEMCRAVNRDVALPLRYGPMTPAEIEDRITGEKEKLAAFLAVDPGAVPEDWSINALVKERCIAIGASAEETARQVTRQFAYVQFLWAYRNNAAWLQAERGVMNVPVSVIDFGAFVLLGVPAEPLVEFNLDLRRRIPDRTVVVAGLFDGSFGYLPHGDNYKEADSDSLYETISTVFAPRAAEALLHGAADLIGPAAANTQGDLR